MPFGSGADGACLGSYTVIYCDVVKPSFRQPWTLSTPRQIAKQKAVASNKSRLSKEEIVSLSIVIFVLSEHSSQHAFCLTLNKALILVSSLNMPTHTGRTAYWTNIIHSNYERLRSMATLTFGDSNGVFSSSLMMWRQLTLADIYTPGSSAQALWLATALFHLCWWVSYRLPCQPLRWPGSWSPSVFHGYCMNSRFNQHTRLLAPHESHNASRHCMQCRILLPLPLI